MIYRVVPARFIWNMKNRVAIFPGCACERGVSSQKVLCAVSKNRGKADQPVLKIRSAFINPPSVTNQFTSAAPNVSEDLDFLYLKPG